MVKKILSFILATLLIFATATTAFAQDFPASASNGATTRSVSLPSNPTYINDTWVKLNSNPEEWTILTLTLPSYVAVLYVELAIYDPDEPNSYYQWEVKRPGYNDYESIELMAPGDYTSCIERITLASAGTYTFRVKGYYDASSSPNKEAYVTFWK